MSEHTKEPWELGDSIAEIRTSEKFIDYIADGSRPKKNARPYNLSICFFSMFLAGWNSISKRGKQDARRIVACVNACAKFSTEQLEDPQNMLLIALNPAVFEVVPVESTKTDV